MGSNSGIYMCILNLKICYSIYLSKFESKLLYPGDLVNDYRGVKKRLHDIIFYPQSTWFTVGQLYILYTFFFFGGGRVSSIMRF